MENVPKVRSCRRDESQRCSCLCEKNQTNLPDGAGHRAVPARFVHPLMLQNGKHRVAYWPSSAVCIRQFRVFRRFGFRVLGGG